MPAMPPPTTRVAGLTGTAHRLERLLVGDPRAPPPETMALAFSVAAALSVRSPGDVLADVGHLEEVGVEAGVRAGAAEGLLVQVRRAGRHDHAVELLLLDVLLDQLLAEARST